MGNSPNPIAGGKRRVIVGKTAEIQTVLGGGWGGTADVLTSSIYVLNPIAGSGGLYPPNIQLLDNAKSAQGQGMALTHRYEGAEDHSGAYKFWLTPEAFGKFAASLMGADAVTTVGTTGYRHAITLSATNEPSPFTLEEHMNGAVDTTDAAKFTGCYCDKLVINSKRGQDFATIEAFINASRHLAASNLGTHDVVSNWPAMPGIPHTKMVLLIDPTTGYASGFDPATVTLPTIPGTIPDACAGATNYSAYVQDCTLSLMANTERGEQYSAGTGISSGFYPGKPYAPDPTFELAVTMDLNSTTASWVRWFRDFAADAPTSELSYSIQLAWVSDTLIAGGTCYMGLCVGLPACTVIGQPTYTRDLKQNTVSVTFGQAQPTTGSLFYAFSWDAYTAGYATT